MGKANVTIGEPRVLTDEDLAVEETLRKMRDEALRQKEFLSKPRTSDETEEFQVKQALDSGRFPGSAVMVKKQDPVTGEVKEHDLSGLPSSFIRANGGEPKSNAELENIKRLLMEKRAARKAGEKTKASHDKDAEFMEEAG